MSISRYLGKIERALAAGNATEHTHRPALKELLESFNPKVTATNEPRREQCGAPDYVVSLETGHGPLTIGYVEAKDVGAPLDDVERSEQLRRYRQFLRNLILTDYLEFRWYVDGDPRGEACLARAGRGGKLKRDSKGAEQVDALMRMFLEQEPGDIRRPQELAARMARLTHMVRDIIIEAIESGRASRTLSDLRKAFSESLIPDLDLPEKTPEFADMYAQTIAYGLFAARCNHRGPQPFRRLGAAAEIPKTNPFLRRLFETITGADLDEEPYAGFVDDLADLLAHADMAAVLEQFGKRTRREDPVVHFYETFLAAYDPKLREARGVYFTPEPVVSYIVRSVDYLLKTRFGCLEGLADTSTCRFDREGQGGEPETETSPRVLILDPACGTGTFLYAVVDHIREQFMASGNAGMWSGYVRNHLLPRLFGFELLMAPYAVAHFKLGMQLAGQDLPSAKLRKEWAYDFAGGAEDRLKVYLTNTLEGIDRAIPDLFGWYKIISDEANSAREIKRDLPIMVVMGNPPYSSSIFEGKWIMSLVADYKKGLREKKSDLAREEWKFLRFAQWRIERTGLGIVALVINNTFLDGISLRRLRQCLLECFSDIYVLDLHGSVLSRKKSPEEEVDQNVFDIEQGVTILILVREAQKRGTDSVRHADLWGLRADKYSYLQSHDVSSTGWNSLQPPGDKYFFVPHATELQAEYEKGWKLPAIFNTYSSGIQTKKDAVSIHFESQTVLDVVRDLARRSTDSAREHYGLGPDSSGWSVEKAQEDLRASGIEQSKVVPMLYRPFDIRFTYYTGKTGGFHGRPRKEIMKHMVNRTNVGLISMRQTVGEEHNHFLVTRLMNCHGTFYLGNRGQDYVFPLYLCASAEEERALLQGQERQTGKDWWTPNLNPSFLANLEKSVKMTFMPDGKGDSKHGFGPEEVLGYLYAVCHSKVYRTRYLGFLKIDFPRVPMTSDKVLFRRLCELGSELVALHLLESPALGEPNFITHYPLPGDNLVEKGHPKYLAPGEPEPGTGMPLAEGRVYIGKDKPREKRQGQYFEGVPREVWEFYVGGYQVCEKWLKDRRGRKLSYDDLTHYQKVVLVLKETIRLMNEIDAAIPSWPIQ